MKEGVAEAQDVKILVRDVQSGGRPAEVALIVVAVAVARVDVAVVVTVALVVEDPPPAVQKLLPREPQAVARILMTEYKVELPGNEART